MFKEGKRMSNLALDTYNFINKCPSIVKNNIGHFINLLPTSLIYGKTFNQTKELLQETDYWSLEKIREYQLIKVKEILSYSYANVPYYNKLLKHHSINVEKIANLEELTQIPCLDKETVKNNFNDLISKSLDKSHMRYVTTGGSTGNPMGFMINNDASVKEWAFMTNQWKRVGYRLKDKRVIIRGCVTNENEKDKIFFYNPIRNELILSSFHMTEENLKKYLELINRFNPEFIHCFPSSIDIIAKYIKQENIKEIPKCKAILASSENIFPDQRELVEEVFGCRYYSWYGHSEKVLLGGECEHSNYYHMFPQYGYMELVDFNGIPVTQEGEVGEIIGTGFLNTAMPFIRYKTGDMGIYTKEECRCGRKYPLIKKIEGRLQEFIISKKGNLISSSALNTHSDAYDNVKKFQFFQDKRGEVILKIVKNDNYTDKDTNKLITELDQKLGGQADFNIEFVSNVELTKRGKHKIIDQKLNINDYLLTNKQLSGGAQ